MPRKVAPQNDNRTHSFDDIEDRPGISLSEAKNILRYRDDWNAFMRDILKLRLDPVQQEIVNSVQANQRTAVGSGHARGKDFVSAAISTTFLYLHWPSKVINTGPTERQVRHIMMAEIKTIINNSILPFGGKFNADSIILDSNWYLLAFKSKDSAEGESRPEVWTGFHSKHVLVVITEASGVADDVFDSVEGVLTGDFTRILLTANPNRTSGRFYSIQTDPRYKKFNLSCLDAPNVVARKQIIPGQVDYKWVADKLGVAGWSQQISKDEFNPDDDDFEFESKYYRPSDLFRVKVLGKFPRESEGTLIPMAWLLKAAERWAELNGEGTGDITFSFDVAGMGTDNSVVARRVGDVVEWIRNYGSLDHMEMVGRVGQFMTSQGNEKANVIVDTIGEGAGSFSRMRELPWGARAFSFKGSEGARMMTDKTGERKFVNMRAWAYWCVRDALDPNLGATLALPPDDMLFQELNTTQYQTRSDGYIIIEEKRLIRKRLGRSPDRADAVSMSFAGSMMSVGLSWGQDVYGIEGVSS